ncbi:hypothetical protein PV08_00721 [Exophiala spinifera]|uniref:Uncharacterized protein n=1 Tax=Exophiala spinifera TaxID=91928 RepID=A0A0D1YXY9_9EURO|nr:uncharacterized protein PV08_00721 [Exophiala spinifera]KIW20146.1 hypothetical protein PV08_00721 [Exophiala spinifera]
MENRGRLGLLYDEETDLEIDALSGAWLLPPAAFESLEEDEGPARAADVDIVLTHVEWVGRSSPKSAITRVRVQIMLKSHETSRKKTKRPFCCENPQAKHVRNNKHLTALSGQKDQRISVITLARQAGDTNVEGNGNVRCERTTSFVKEKATSF